MKKVLLLHLFVLLASCELVVDIDVPLERQQLTLNSFFTPDSVWSARLSLNRHVLDDSPFKTVDDALVVMYRQGTPIDTLVSIGDGMYLSENGKPETASSYEISATSTKYGTVSGASSVPAPVIVNHIDFEVQESTPMDGPKLITRLTIQDRPGEKNFYQVLAMMEITTKHPYTGEIRTYRNPVYLETNDPSINNENMDSNEGIFFNDVLFDGEAKKVTLEAHYWGGFGSSNEAKLLLYLRTASEEYYKYKTTAILQENVSGDPFAQPVIVYNNIANGFGIFGGYSQSEFVFTP